jgi:hypothetical protein
MQNGVRSCRRFQLTDWCLEIGSDWVQRSEMEAPGALVDDSGAI